MMNLRLIFVSLVWGVNFAFIKYALRDFGPLSFTIARFLLAAAALFALLGLRGVPLRVSGEDRLPLIGLGLAGITFYSIFFMYGLRYTTASNSALLIAMSPLFAALIQAVRGKERLSRHALAGTLLAAFGVFLIIRDKPGGLSLSAEGLQGDLLTICASVLWALYTLSARPLLARHDPVKVTAYTMVAGSILLTPLGAGELLQQDWSAVGDLSWAAFLFSAFIAGSAAYSLWYQGVKQLGVTRTIVYHYLVPVVAVVFASFFLGERITLFQVLGSGMVLSGVYLVQRKNQP